MSEIDEIDLRLLRLLSENADRSAGALAKALGMSQPAIWRRIKRLEESGVIKGYRWILNREKLGLGVTVFLGSNFRERGVFQLMILNVPSLRFQRYKRSNMSSGCMITVCALWPVTLQILNAFCAVAS